MRTDRRRNNWEVGECYKRQHDPYNVNRWADEKPGMFRSVAQTLMVIAGGIFCTAMFWLFAVFVLGQ